MEKQEQLLIGNLLNDMSAGIMVIGFDGRVILRNHAAAELLELPEDMQTYRYLEQIMCTAEENDTFFGQLFRAVSEKQPISKTLPFFRNGEMLYYHLSTDAFGIGGDNSSAGMIVQVTDITEATNLFIANKRLANQVTNLMKSFVEVMVTAIEEESAYNANHTKSMVQYAKRYFEWLEAEGTLDDFTQESTEAILMSIWLHDIGKLLVPKEILDKPTRLGSARKDVIHRIETAMLLLRIQVLEHPELLAETDKKRTELERAGALILSADTAGFLTDETVSALEHAAQIRCPAADGTELPLLSEKELEQITVRRGTLTAEERKIVESHVILTGKLLSKVEFRGGYRSVPVWAAGHHEMLDGSGYPNHLQGAEIPKETRLLTIVDVYDALTAEDRPYKPPMPPEKAFAILRDMAEKGKLDRAILESFYLSGAWKRDSAEPKK